MNGEFILHILLWYSYLYVDKFLFKFIYLFVKFLYVLEIQESVVHFKYNLFSFKLNMLYNEND